MNKENKVIPRLMATLFILFSVILLVTLFYFQSVTVYLADRMEEGIQAWLMETGKRGRDMVTTQELE